MILVGMDEAGYGPMLGPLVVSAAAFQSRSAPNAVMENLAAVDLWELLKNSVTRKPDRSRIPVNDSKKIYHSGKGLGCLEEGVLPFFQLRDSALPPTLRDLVCRVMRHHHADAYLESYPWYQQRNLPIPTATYPQYLRVTSATLNADLEAQGIHFLGLASVPIEVLQFNTILSQHDNKALVPFQAIGKLLARVWKSFPGENIEVVVDRQGGRIHYAPLLFRALAPRGIQIECQNEESSIYRLRRDQGVMRITFTIKGDSKAFPVALASMMSKYLRELHMAVFNQFWKEQMLSLQPTAGYPTDARRFLKDISGLRQELGIKDEMLIRRR